MSPEFAGALGFFGGGLLVGALVIWRAAVVIQGLQAALVQARQDVNTYASALARVAEAQAAEGGDVASQVFARALARAPELFETHRKIEAIREQRRAAGMEDDDDAA